MYGPRKVALSKLIWHGSRHTCGSPRTDNNLNPIASILQAGTEDGPTQLRDPIARKGVKKTPKQDGMKVQGYNGSMAWDTAFAVQAVVEAGMVESYEEPCSRLLQVFLKVFSSCSVRVP